MLRSTVITIRNQFTQLSSKSPYRFIRMLGSLHQVSSGQIPRMRNNEQAATMSQEHCSIICCHGSEVNRVQIGGKSDVSQIPKHDLVPVVIGEQSQ